MAARSYTWCFYKYQPSEASEIALFEKLTKENGGVKKVVMYRDRRHDVRGYVEFYQFKTACCLHNYYDGNIGWHIVPRTEKLHVITRRCGLPPRYSMKYVTM